jgi:PAS domain S-box-containing protein
MFTAHHNRSLTRRLSEQYLLFGLSGLFFFTVFAVFLSRYGFLLQLIPAAVGIPLGFLLLGSFVLRRTSYWHENIERQLTRFAKSSDHSVAELRPLPATDALAAGWNQLLARILEYSAWNGVERRLSEAVDSQQAKRWEAVFQDLTDGIAVCNSDGRIIQLNRSFATLLQQPVSKNLVGLDIIELLLGQADENSQEQIRGLGNNHATQVLEIQKSADPSQGVYRLSRTMHTGDSGSPADSIWTLRDVTQQKLAEKAREQFVFTATHELRTPLANIRAYSETLALASEIPVEEQQSFYNIINNEATRLARFIDELLNISQMEAGAITIQKHEVQLERLLSEVLEGQRPVASEKKQAFDSAIAPKLPKLMADKDKLAAALTNLISNAIKYTPVGGKVTLKVDSDSTRILFMVEDSGIGISADDLPKLCGKFFRSSDERVQAEVGTGLGLAFAHEVARLHGGSVSIRSQLNQGSCFTLEIPIR